MGTDELEKEVRMTLGIDVDGVLAAFEVGYVPILTEVSGVEFPRLGDEDWPDCWEWDEAAGVSMKDIGEAWKIIKASPSFWESLPPVEGAMEFLRRIWEVGKDTYFVTNRPGLTSKAQTERWLKRLGFPRPTVIVSADKAGICRAVGITHYIDDKTENCEAVREDAPFTECYMLAKPWNFQVYGVPRLKGLEKFNEIVEREA